MRYNSQVLHGGKRPEQFGATLPPVYQTSAFAHDTAQQLEKIFENKAQGYCYTRVANPTVTAFESRITVLEGGIGSVAFASGMAALTNAFLNILTSGDEIVTSASLYGGTIDLFRDFEAFGIHTVYVLNNNWEQFEKAITEKTKLIFAETIGNPGLDVTDIEKLAELAHRHHIPLFIDNTTATTYLVRPLELGADIVINSASKYINGNSSGISGVITDGGKFHWKNADHAAMKDYLKYGPAAYLVKLRATLYRNTGACLAPQNAFLNLIGVETLALRMERQCQNARKLAEWISENYPEYPVNYPGLQTSRWHVTASKVLQKGYGAILTLRLGSKEKAFQFINGLKLAYCLSNIGDTKTLVVHPASTISLHSTPSQRKDAGVTEDLVRVSVGIEDIEDLIEDFKDSFESI